MRDFSSPLIHREDAFSLSNLSVIAHARLLTHYRAERQPLIPRVRNRVARRSSNINFADAVQYAVFAFNYRSLRKPCCLAPLPLVPSFLVPVSFSPSSSHPSFYNHFFLISRPNRFRSSVTHLQSTWKELMPLVMQ